MFGTPIEPTKIVFFTDTANFFIFSAVDCRRPPHETSRPALMPYLKSRLVVPLQILRRLRNHAFHNRYEKSSEKIHIRHRMLLFQHDRRWIGDFVYGRPAENTGKYSVPIRSPMVFSTDRDVFGYTFIRIHIGNLSSRKTPV